MTPHSRSPSRTSRSCRVILKSPSSSTRAGRAASSFPNKVSTPSPPPMAINSRPPPMPTPGKSAALFPPSMPSFTTAMWTTPKKEASASASGATSPAASPIPRAKNPSGTCLKKPEPLNGMPPPPPSCPSPASRAGISHKNSSHPHASQTTCTFSPCRSWAGFRARSSSSSFSGVAWATTQPFGRSGPEV